MRRLADRTLPTDKPSTSLSGLPLLAGEMPTVTTATAGVAAGYVGSAQAASTPSASSSASRELEALRVARSGGKVADLTKRLTESSLGQAGLTHSNPWAGRCSARALTLLRLPPFAGEGSDPGEAKRTPVAEIEGKSKATSVDAMRKYREAKEAELKEANSPSGRDERPAPPPKVDLYK